MTLSAALELAPVRYRAPLEQVIREEGITNIAEFLGTLFYESAYLTRFEENLNYSTDALLKKFSRRRISYEDAVAYGRGPGRAADRVKIANTIYGGPFGLEQLGNTQPNDGWHFRGQGPIQLTGRANWKAFSTYLKMPQLMLDPGIALRDPLLACKSASFFWIQLKGLNKLGKDMRAITKVVTGAADTAIKSRLEYRDRVQKLLDQP